MAYSYCIYEDSLCWRGKYISQFPHHPEDVTVQVNVDVSGALEAVEPEMVLREDNYGAILYYGPSRKVYVVFFGTGSPTVLCTQEDVDKFMADHGSARWEILPIFS